MNTLAQEDIEFAFGPGAALSAFTQLSPEEMAVIEGEYWPIFFRNRFRALAGFARSIFSRSWFKLGNYAFKIHHDTKLHNFGKIWGPLQGPRQHWQLGRKAIRLNDKGRPMKSIRNNEGKRDWPAVKGSYKAWRIPLGDKGKMGKQPPQPKSSAMSADESAAENGFTPSEVLIAQLIREIQIREDWLRERGGAQPTSVRNTDAGDSGYEGPLPSRILRGYLFGITQQTNADVCRDYGASIHGC